VHNTKLRLSHYNCLVKFHDVGITCLSAPTMLMRIKMISTKLTALVGIKIPKSSTVMNFKMSTKD
jgi:hypothetical protein